MLSLDIQRVESVQQQLERLIREKIYQGEISVGTRLPAAAQWAKELGTSYPALHAALNKLAQEGLVERRRRAGTFVISNSSVATRAVGVYCAHSIWQIKHYSFARAIHDSLSARLKSEGLTERVWIDGRRQEEQGTPLPELVSAIKNGEIQSLIVLLANADDLAWLKSLPIPSSFLSSGNIPNRIAFDFHEFFELSLDYLKAQGCRSVGCIASVVPGKSETDFIHPFTAFYENFMLISGSNGLNFRNSWVVMPERNEEIQNPELYGYIKTQKFLTQHELPDGLILFPDEMALGATRALVDRYGADTPFKLVIHRNAGTERLFPSINAAWVGNSTSEVVDGMFRQISEQVKKGATQPIVVPFSFLDAPGGREEAEPKAAS